MRPRPRIQTTNTHVSCGRGDVKWGSYPIKLVDALAGLGHGLLTWCCWRHRNALPSKTVASPSWTRSFMSSRRAGAGKRSGGTLKRSLCVANTAPTTHKLRFAPLVCATLLCLATGSLNTYAPGFETNLAESRRAGNSPGGDPAQDEVVEPVCRQPARRGGADDDVGEGRRGVRPLVMLCLSAYHQNCTHNTVPPGPSDGSFRPRITATS